MATKKYKWFTSRSTTIAPQLSNTWGALTNILDSCLVTGYGSAFPSDIQVSGSKVTFTYTAAHGYLQYQVISVSGTGSTQLDTEHRILSVSSDGLSFVIEVSEVTAVSATNVETKLAPLGWENLYTDANKRVYKTTSKDYKNYYYFVDNECPAGYTTTWAKYARVGIAEGWVGDMEPAGLTIPADWDTWKPSGTGTTMQLGHGKIWYHTNTDASNTTTPTAVAANGNGNWYIIGCESYVYIFNTTRPNSVNYLQSGFGMYQPLHKGFQYNAFLSCSSYLHAANQTTSLHTDHNTLVYINRATMTFSGYGNLNDKSLYPLCFSNITYSGQANQLGVGGPINYFTPIFRDSTSVLMGSPEGLYWLGRIQPYTHEAIINKGGIIHLALNIVANGQACQVVLLIGDLNEA